MKRGSRTSELVAEYFAWIRGRTPFDVEPYRTALMDKAGQARRPGAVAFSAIEQCLHDIQGKALGVPCWALFGGRLVITIGKYGRGTKLAGEGWDFPIRPTMTNNQPAAPGAQRGIKFDQRFTDEMDAPISFRGQGVKNLAIKNKGAIDVVGFGQRRAERRMVVVAQIAAEPDQGLFNFHGWFVPRRRLKFQSWKSSTSPITF